MGQTPFGWLACWHAPHFFFAFYFVVATILPFWVWSDLWRNAPMLIHSLLTTMDCHPPFAAAARRHPRSILLLGPFLSILLLSSTAKYFSASAYNMPKDKIKK